MRPEDDFTAYVAARWPALVRELALLGCPDELVEDVVVDGLARCRRSWAATVRRGDADVVVPEAVLTAWTERRRTSWWVGVAAPSEDPDRVAAAVLLDRMPEAERVATVRAGSDLLDRAAAAVPVLAPPLDEVRRRRVPHRPGRGRRVALGVGAALAAAAVATAAVVPALSGVDERRDPSALAPLPVRAADNPVAVAWVAGGELHLRRAVVDTGPVVDLVEIPGGAAYLDAGGRVLRVDERGRRELLGRADPTAGLAGSAGGGLVVWRERASGDLVVHDVRRDDEAARVAGTSLRPVAVDDDRLYYNSTDGSVAVLLPDGDPRRLRALPLLDVRAGTMLLRGDRGRVLLRSQRERPGTFEVGQDGELSDDGRFALVTTARGDRVALDILGGRPATGVAPGERVVAARLADEGTIVVAVVPADRAEPADPGIGRRSEAGSWELRTCVLGTGDCSTGTRIPAAGPVPLFAR